MTDPQGRGPVIILVASVHSLMMGADWVFIFMFIFFNEMGIICTNIAVKKRQEARVCSEMEFLSMCWGVRWVLKKED